MSELVCCWCSKASSLQRAGRTGRVAPGTVIHLFTEKFYNESMPDFDNAEILRLPLEKTVLRIKLLLPEFGTATQLLQESLTPPPQEYVSAAVISLYEAGALVSANDKAEVTVFGELAAQLPVDLPLVKLLLLGQTFGCLPDAIVMAAALSLQDIFLMPCSLFVSCGKYHNTLKSLPLI
jgi:HrpA-like RNA helicase